MNSAKVTITRILEAHPDFSGAGWKYRHTRDHAAKRARVLANADEYERQFKRAVEYLSRVRRRKSVKATSYGWRVLFLAGRRHVPKPPFQQVDDVRRDLPVTAAVALQS